MRKSLCIVLAFVISSLSIATYVLADDNETTNNTTTPDLHTEQQQLQQQIEDANEELNDVQDELSENLQQVKKLDDRLNEQALKLAGVIYAANDGIDSYLVNPIDGDLSKLKNVIILTGTNDILNPDVDVLKEKR